MRAKSYRETFSVADFALKRYVSKVELFPLSESNAAF